MDGIPFVDAAYALAGAGYRRETGIGLRTIVQRVQIEHWTAPACAGPGHARIQGDHV